MLEKELRESTVNLPHPQMLGFWPPTALQNDELWWRHFCLEKKSSINTIGGPE